MRIVGDGWHGLPRRWAIAGLFAANLAPLAGVVTLGWDAGQLLVFYWLENGVVGAANVPKVVLAGAERDDRIDWAGRIGSAMFFLGHYGMFWLVHGIFVVVLVMATAGGSLRVPELLGPGLFLAVGAVVFGQAVEFWTDFLRDGQYRDRTTREQMTEPYGRVMVLHVVIIVGAFPVFELGSPLPALLMLVGLKFLIDLWGYAREVDTATAGPADTRGDAIEGEP